MQPGEGCVLRAEIQIDVGAGSGGGVRCGASADVAQARGAVVVDPAVPGLIGGIAAPGAGASPQRLPRLAETHLGKDAVGALGIQVPGVPRVNAQAVARSAPALVEAEVGAQGAVEAVAQAGAVVAVEVLVALKGSRSAHPHAFPQLLVVVYARPPVQTAGPPTLMPLQPRLDLAVQQIAPGICRFDPGQPARALAPVGGKEDVPVIVRGDVVTQIAQLPLALGAAEADGPSPEAGSQDSGLAVLAQREDVEGNPHHPPALDADVDRPGNGHIVHQDLDARTVEVEVRTGIVAGGVGPPGYVEFPGGKGADTLAPVNRLVAADDALPYEGLFAPRVVADVGPPQGLGAALEQRLFHRCSIAVHEPARGDHARRAGVDHVAGFEHHPLVGHHRVSPQEDGVAAGVAQKGIRGILEARFAVAGMHRTQQVAGGGQAGCGGVRGRGLGAEPARGPEGEEREDDECEGVREHLRISRRRCAGGIPRRGRARPPPRR